MKKNKPGISESLLLESYTAGAVYVILAVTIFRGKSDSTVAVLFFVAFWLVFPAIKESRKGIRSHIACISIILWACMLIWFNANIGWAVYAIALIIIPSFVSIVIRMLGSKDMTESNF